MKHILIVDDDIHINQMLDEVLVHERYMVSHAYSGTEALLFLADTKPDLILLDLMLPGLSGEELLPQIAEIPVIVMSAKADIENKVSLLLGGAVDYVTLDTFTYEVFIADQKVKLTRTEYAILKLLMQNPKQVIAKSFLLEKISEDTPDCTENSLKMHISNLRKKLREISQKDYIEAVWGIGFKMITE